VSIRHGAGPGPGGGWPTRGTNRGRERKNVSHPASRCLRGNEETQEGRDPQGSDPQGTDPHRGASHTTRERPTQGARPTQETHRQYGRDRREDPSLGHGAGAGAYSLSSPRDSSPPLRSSRTLPGGLGDAASNTEGCRASVDAASDTEGCRARAGTEGGGECYWSIGAAATGAPLASLSPQAERWGEVLRWAEERRARHGATWEALDRAAGGRLDVPTWGKGQARAPATMAAATPTYMPATAAAAPSPKLSEAEAKRAWLSKLDVPTWGKGQTSAPATTGAATPTYTPSAAAVEPTMPKLSEEEAQRGVARVDPWTKTDSAARALANTHAHAHAQPRRGPTTGGEGHTGDPHRTHADNMGSPDEAGGAVKRSTGHTPTHTTAEHTTAEHTTHTNTERATGGAVKGAADLLPGRGTVRFASVWAAIEAAAAAVAKSIPEGAPGTIAKSMLEEAPGTVAKSIPEGAADAVAESMPLPHRGDLHRIDPHRDDPRRCDPHTGLNQAERGSVGAMGLAPFSAPRTSALLLPAARLPAPFSAPRTPALLLPAARIPAPQTSALLLPAARIPAPFSAPRTSALLLPAARIPAGREPGSRAPPFLPPGTRPGSSPPLSSPPLSSLAGGRAGANRSPAASRPHRVAERVREERDRRLGHENDVNMPTPPRYSLPQSDSEPGSRAPPSLPDDDDCIPPRDTSPHQDSTGTAPSGTPPPAQPPPPPRTRGTQSHSAPTPLKRPMLTPELPPGTSRLGYGNDVGIPTPPGYPLPHNDSRHGPQRTPPALWPHRATAQREGGHTQQQRPREWAGAVGASCAAGCPTGMPREWAGVVGASERAGVVGASCGTESPTGMPREWAGVVGASEWAGVVSASCATGCPTGMPREWAGVVGASECAGVAGVSCAAGCPTGMRREWAGVVGASCAAGPLTGIPRDWAGVVGASEWAGVAGASCAEGPPTSMPREWAGVVGASCAAGPLIGIHATAARGDSPSVEASGVFTANPGVFTAGLTSESMAEWRIPEGPFREGGPTPKLPSGIFPEGQIPEGNFRKGGPTPKLPSGIFSAADGRIPACRGERLFRAAVMN